MRIMPIIASLAVPVVLVGGVAVAEQASARSLTNDLTERVEKALPGADVTHVNLRGRPYVVSRNNDEVSTAYVDIDTAEQGASAQLLVQNLDLNKDRAGRVRVFLTLPYPGAGKPIENPDGSYSSRATVDGKELAFHARFSGGKVTVTTQGGPDLGTVNAPSLPGQSLVGEATAVPKGVLVELISRDVRMAG
ncbi:hypothetical protein ABFU82_18455 [Nocardioides sp. WV_118_6]